MAFLRYTDTTITIPISRYSLGHRIGTIQADNATGISYHHHTKYRPIKSFLSFCLITGHYRSTIVPIRYTTVSGPQIPASVPLQNTIVPYRSITERPCPIDLTAKIIRPPELTESQLTFHQHESHYVENQADLKFEIHQSDSVDFMLMNFSWPDETLMSSWYQSD